jgi:hypothetical protein
LKQGLQAAQLSNSNAERGEHGTMHCHAGFKSPLLSVAIIMANDPLRKPPH